MSRSLPDLLQQFSTRGLNSSLASSDHIDGSDQSLTNFEDGQDDEELADKWTDVIDERENMTRQQKNQQEAIWELLSTEYKYVGKIRVIPQVSSGFSGPSMSKNPPYSRSHLTRVYCTF